MPQKPNKKVQAVGIAGVLTAVIVGVCRHAGIDLEPELAASIAALIATLAGYFVREPVPATPPKNPTP